jgi:hypothetical protein
MLDNLRDGERCHNTTLIIADFDTGRRRRHSIVDIVPDDIAGTFLGQSARRGAAGADRKETTVPLRVRDGSGRATRKIRMGLLRSSRWASP